GSSSRSTAPSQRGVAEAIRAALTEAGYTTYPQVWAALVRSGRDKQGSERSFRRYYRDGPPDKPRAKSEAILEALLSLTTDASRVRDLCRRWWDDLAGLRSEAVPSVESKG